MTKFYNIKSMTKRRRQLRQASPRAEAILWRQLIGKQLAGYKFRRQYSVGGYVVDFYCPKLKLAIEIDGPSHFSSYASIEYDRRRQLFIESCGLRMVRFTNRDVYQNLSGVIEYLIEYINNL
ncbi:MAG: endonuclease domain-containing protein [Patescibacteria group bacterium]